MKIYRFKALLYGTAAACMMAGFTACQEFRIDSQAEFPPQMEIDAQTSYSLLAQSPNVITFNISSNTPWTIKSNAQWCTPDPAMSSASSLVAEITVTTEDNTSETARTATLTVTAEDVAEPFVITVTQEAKDAFILQAPEEGNIAQDGGSKLFKVISNKPWKITTEAIWLEFSALEGEATSAEGEEVTVRAKDNSGMERTALVTVASGLGTKTFEVTQDGIVLRFEEIDDESSLIAGCLGETLQFKVNSNIAWKPGNVEYDNILLEKTDEETLSVTVTKANKYFTTQYYEITVVPEDDAMTAVEPAALTVGQQAIAWCSNCSANEDGSVTFISDNTESRVCTNAGLAMGTLLWTFRDINLSSGLFDINAWQSPGPTFHAWVGGGSKDMNTGGGLESGEDFWAQGSIDADLEDINGMQTLKLTIFPVDDGSELEFTMYIDDRQVGQFTTPCNPWGEMGESPVPYYFGFANDSGAVGSMTVTSFEYTPYEE